MQNIKVPQTVSLVTQKVAFEKIHNIFSATYHGKILQQRIRFGIFKPNWMKNEDWVKLLGPDVSNLEHLIHTLHIAESFLRISGNQFTDDDKELLLLSAVIHDWGEGIRGHFDKPYAEKTATDGDSEFNALKRIIRNKVKIIVLDKKDQDALAKKMRHVVTEIIQKQEGQIGEAFNAIERAGYMQTALTAWELSKKEKNEDVKLSLQGIACTVHTNQTKTLLDYKKKYPYIHTLLEENKNTISEVFAILPKEAFNFFKDKEKKQEKFAAAKELWFAAN